VGEDDHEQEEIVDTERVLDQIARDELEHANVAQAEVDRDGEGNGSRDPQQGHEVWSDAAVVLARTSLTRVQLEDEQHAHQSAEPSNQREIQDVSSPLDTPAGWCAKNYAALRNE
jgi:hypothetical protein